LFLTFHIFLMHLGFRLHHQFLPSTRQPDPQTLGISQMSS
jgi:hypothetical protein